MKISIRFKLMCFAFLIVLLVGGTISSYSIQKGRERILDEFQKKCFDTTALISRVITDDLYFLDIRSLRLKLRTFQVNPDIFYTHILDTEGRLLSDGTRNNLKGNIHPGDEFNRRMQEASTWISDISEEILTIGGPILLPDNRLIGYLQVGFSLSGIMHLIQDNTLSTIYISLICLGLGGIMALLLARNFSLPIQELVRASEMLRKGDLLIQLSIRRGDELGLLAESFNKMSREIHHLVESEQKRSQQMARSNELLQNEIQERKRVMIALQESEQRYRHIFENSPICLWEEDFSELRQYINTLNFNNMNDFSIYLDAHPLEIRRCLQMIHIIDVNRMTLDVFEAETKDQMLCHLNTFVPERGYKATKKALIAIASGEVFEIEALNQTLTGRNLHVQVKSSIVDGPNAWERVIVSVQDITERVQAEEQKLKLQQQIEQTRKMEAIATMAGGIAHEFNNALAVISGNTELLKMKLETGKDPNRYFDAIMGSCDRLASLTDQLLAYSQGGTFYPKEVVFEEFVTETLRVIRHSMSGISIESDFSDFNGMVKIDRAQFQMVMSAILSNAAEACDSEGEIRVNILTEMINGIDSQNMGLSSGMYACLRVSDNGKGMDEKTRQRIFEPFFTTKFHGRGLGMAAVFGIVKNHGGHITIETEPDVGTCVQVYLPLLAPVLPSPPELPPPDSSVSIPVILLVEDEEMVMEVSRSILEILNYQVIEARTGQEAVDILQHRETAIDVVILDMKLPDMDGDKVYDLIREIKPDIRVLVCSGYSIDGPAQKVLAAGAQGFVQKPFSVDTISSKLNEVLSPAEKE